VIYFLYTLYKMHIEKYFIIALMTVIVLFVVCQVHVNLYGTPFPNKEGLMGKYKTWGGNEWAVPYPAQWRNEYS
jgi:hypothetical protein